MGRPRSVPYKNRHSAIDDGYLDELCTESRNEMDALRLRHQPNSNTIVSGVAPNGMKFTGY